MSTHLRSHNIKSKEYTKKYLNQNYNCKVCEEETKYKSFEFTDFCKEHTLPGASPSKPIQDNKELLEKYHKNKKYKDFFDKNHIQESTNSSWAYGLIYDDELVSCMSVRGAIHYDADEIARFCNKTFHHAPGALSRLMSYVRDESGRDLISYADLMHGDGNGYNKFGFEFSHDTVVNYWYTDGYERYSRQTFKATENRTEKQVAEDAGVFRIYGAGNKLYKLDN